jgi:hypothetical protein
VLAVNGYATTMMSKAVVSDEERRSAPGRRGKSGGGDAVRERPRCRFGLGQMGDVGDLTRGSRL